MEFTKEQIKKARDTKCAEELLALAKENGMELTEEETEKLFFELHREGEISDSELDAVTGGATNCVAEKFSGRVLLFRASVHSKYYIVLDDDEDNWCYGELKSINYSKGTEYTMIIMERSERFGNPNGDCFSSLYWSMYTKKNH